MKATVMGLGLNNGGVGVVKYLAHKGYDIIITDLKTESILKDSIEIVKNISNIKVEFILGEHREQDFQNTDLVVKNPGVPDSSKFLQIAKNSNVRVTTDIELFFEEINRLHNKPTVVGITGTRGKTTTTSLIYHILKLVFGESRVFLGGNIRMSVLDLVDKVTKDDFVVLELSSFQLSSLKYSPNIAVFTNLYPDHLNRYVTMDEYLRDKMNIFINQSQNDTLVINQTQDILLQASRECKSQVIYFDIKETSNIKHFVRDGFIYYNNQKILEIKDLNIKGEHNLYNIMAAITVLSKLEVNSNFIKDGLITFQSVVGRQEKLGEFEGVEIINDTTSTMPEALYTAIKTFEDRPLTIICGGNNKNLEYTELYSIMKNSEYIKNIILIPGDATNKFKEELKEIDRINIFEVDNMEQAVIKSKEILNRNERLILSPGATSFGQFNNEFERGDSFVYWVNKYFNEKED